MPQEESLDSFFPLEELLELDFGLSSFFNSSYWPNDEQIFAEPGTHLMDNEGRFEDPGQMDPYSISNASRFQMSRMLQLFNTEDLLHLRLTALTP